MPKSNARASLRGRPEPHGAAEQAGHDDPDPARAPTLPPTPDSFGAGFFGRRLRMHRNTLIVVLGFVGLIELGSLFFPPYVFPDVVQIALGIRDAVVLNHSDIVRSVGRFVLALSLATIGGWALGLLMGAFRRHLSGLVAPALNIFQAVPALSWILVSVLWISSIERRITFICFVIGMPFFAIAVFEGLRDIDNDLVKAIDQFRPSRWQVLRLLLLPQSVIYLLLSVRSTASLLLRILVFAEMIGATSGIGERMGVALANFRMDLIFAWTVIMIIINFVLVWMVERAERWLLRWRDEAVVR